MRFSVSFPWLPLFWESSVKPPTGVCLLSLRAGQPPACEEEGSCSLVGGWLTDEGMVHCWGVGSLLGWQRCPAREDLERVSRWACWCVAAHLLGTTCKQPRYTPGCWDARGSGASGWLDNWPQRSCPPGPSLFPSLCFATLDIGLILQLTSRWQHQLEPRHPEGWRRLSSWGFFLGERTFQPLPLCDPNPQVTPYRPSLCAGLIQRKSVAVCSGEWLPEACPGCTAARDGGGCLNTMPALVRRRRRIINAMSAKGAISKDDLWFHCVLGLHLQCF